MLSCGGGNDQATTDEDVQQFLDKAQSTMKEIGVPISFKSVEPIGDIQQFADPLELGVLEDIAISSIETSVAALNDALNVGGFPGGALPAAPTAAFQEVDKELGIFQNSQIWS